MVVSLLRDPWNAIASFIRDAYTSSACKAVAKRRGTFAGVPEWDIGVPQSVARKKGSTHQSIFRSVFAGAIWTGHESFKAGYEEQPLCRFCGQETDGLRHLYWRCPFFHEVRQSVPGFDSLDVSALPAGLALYGAAPAVSASWDTELWVSASPDQPYRPEELA
eukprot:10364000-Alexandrium_andersonii.AAC.1